jgi:Ca-activated chloride channel family protein
MQTNLLMKINKLTKIVLISLFVCLTIILRSQTKNVKGSVTTTDTAELRILNIFPDSFPTISVLFKAEKRNGEPVWNLTKDKMHVNENSQACNVISLEKISVNKPINLGIVIDHSGSMAHEDYRKFLQNMSIPDTGITPLENAKTSVKNFVNRFKLNKDFLSIIGFAGEVDFTIPLSQNKNDIKSGLDSLQPKMGTAFYDAIIAGINQIKNANGVKIIIALTDGYDNSSVANCKDVIILANKEEIPIYVIGFGDVNKDTLKLISNSTKGNFYFVKSSEQLNTIYSLISYQIQSIYNLVYSSPNYSATDENREIELTFDSDDLIVSTNPEKSNFPKEVMAFISKKEREKEYLINGIIIGATLISALSLLVYSRKKQNVKQSPIIKLLYPNPVIEIATIEFECENGQLKIYDNLGVILKTFDLNGNQIQINLGELVSGYYFAVIESEGQKSNTVKFVVQ